MFQLFKNIFYRYEKDVEESNLALKQKIQELNTVNLSLESKVIERTCDLQESNEKIIDLAFITAHEIRGPLSSILSVTQYLKNNPGDHSIDNVLPDLHEKSVTMDTVIRKMVVKLEGEIIELEKAGINKSKR
jgi:light-regulated signal transduction histidine kinase (bacteriophytochrome)